MTNKASEIEKGILKILQLTNYNPSSSYIEIPFILNLILYYLLNKGNITAAITLINTRKLTEGVIGGQQI